MNDIEEQYLSLCRDALAGTWKRDRSGGMTVGGFGALLRHDMRDGFPLLTTKRMSLRVIFEELAWFLGGKGNRLDDLLARGVNIWNADAYKRYAASAGPEALTMAEYVERVRTDRGFADVHGDLGPIYGVQWERQIGQIHRMLREEPDSRRMVVSAWSPSEIGDMVLPPCHMMWQVLTRPLTDSERERHPGMERAMSLCWTQRSADLPLGLPYNIASYAMLLMMLSATHGMVPAELVGMVGSYQVYEDQAAPLGEQLSRSPRPLPVMRLERRDDLKSYVFSDFTLEGYDPHPAIRYPLTV